jgi:hypothetical protein
MHLGASNSLTDYIVEQALRDIRPRSWVDFGAGAGKYGQMVKRVLGEDCRLTAVEGYAPTVAYLRDAKIYETVHESLLQNWLADAAQGGQFHDVAIFGDVLEHLTPRQGHAAIETALSVFTHVFIVVPLHDIFQDSIEGNDLEIHRSYITPQWFDRYQPVQKHIVCGERYTVLLVHLTQSSPAPAVRRIVGACFHAGMLVLQPVGLARPMVELLKRVGRRHKSLLRA